MMDSTIFTVEELTHDLIFGKGPVPRHSLHCLSDLGGEEISVLEEYWLLVPGRRRIETVRSCLELLGASRILQFQAFLASLLSDPLPEVRALAAEGIGLDIRADSLEELLRMAAEDESEEVRLAAVLSLGQGLRLGEGGKWGERLQMRIREGLTRLIGNLDQPLALQSAAVASLGFSPGAIFDNVIAEAYQSELEELRVSAVTAMGRSGDSRWSDLVLQAFDDQSSNLRTAAVVAGARLELHTFLDISLDIIEVETDPALRLAAIAALGQLGGPIASEGLLLAAASEDPIEQEAALQAMEGQELTDGASFS